MSILGELPTSQGQIEVKGKIAYVSQQPWVFSASLRQNITMGAPFDATLYDKAIRACALKKVWGYMSAKRVLFSNKVSPLRTMGYDVINYIMTS